MERWDIKVTADGPSDYARQLDSLKVRLAAVHAADTQIHYVYRLTAATPSSAAGSRESFNESGGILFFHRVRGPKELDVALFNKANVPTSGYHIGWYLSASIRTSLRELEHAALAGRPESEVLRTTFGIRQRNGGYEWCVVEVEFK